MPELTLGEQANILRNLIEVGSTKSIGYLPLCTIRDFLGKDVRILAKEAINRGMSAIIVGPNECCIKSGALYVYNDSMLSNVLTSNLPLLRAAGCPMTPARFVRHIAATWFDANERIIPVIKSAFGDAL
jgi:hypothetical protein